MISEWFLQLAAAVGTGVMSWLPDDDWSDGMVMTATNALSSLFAAMGAISAWFPWDVFVICFAATIGSYVLLFAVKVSRQVLAHIPFVGGSG